MINEVRDLLAEDRFLVYQHNELRQTPLHVAVKRDYIEIVRLLIRYHSDVSAKDSMGKTPLYHAALENNRMMCTVLIANMSSCFATDAQGTTLKSIASDSIVKLILHKGKEVSDRFINLTILLMHLIDLGGVL